MCQGYLYVLGGYGINKGYAGNAWKLHVATLLRSFSRVSILSRSPLVLMFCALRLPEHRLCC